VLTHELLGVMLGAHRPGVTLAVQALEDRGLISAKRGQIKIFDRSALEKEANGAYLAPDR
jgi:Crp-like helix-turn-helix domain